ncbi:hypothetical protein EVAR_64687_1 [Eumeta japonica]|uniref:Uncharacterized protein n=1 Tax=Eumeta variegata TaxID=151549 RepID=A0A4C1ZM72_EUMVA|nr:hypothetical protein EVAR_64687_1 [Eumeta japonica]
MVIATSRQSARGPLRPIEELRTKKLTTVVPNALIMSGAGDLSRRGRCRQCRQTTLNMFINSWESRKADDGVGADLDLQQVQRRQRTQVQQERPRAKWNRNRELYWDRNHSDNGLSIEGELRAEPGEKLRSKPIAGWSNRNRHRHRDEICRKRDLNGIYGGVYAAAARAPPAGNAGDYNIVITFPAAMLLMCSNTAVCAGCGALRHVTLIDFRCVT